MKEQVSEGFRLPHGFTNGRSKLILTLFTHGR